MKNAGQARCVGIGPALTRSRSDNKNPKPVRLASSLAIDDLPEFDVERAKGIEPSALAWEARVLPLYDARAGHYSTTVRVISTTPGRHDLALEPPSAQDLAMVSRQVDDTTKQAMI